MEDETRKLLSEQMKLLAERAKDSTLCSSEICDISRAMVDIARLLNRKEFFR